VSVEVRTDEPDRRFAVGSALRTSTSSGPARAGSAVERTLTVEGARWHSGRLLLHFEGVDDRTAAESLRGLLLQVEVDPSEVPVDPEEFYDHQLVGLTVVDRSGARVGRVVDVVHGAQDLLVVDRAPVPDGAVERGAARTETAVQAMVPFVHALVPEVDLASGRLVVDLPDGLLDLASE
jgi:16S rRNA processing protein RimM